MRPGPRFAAVCAAWACLAVTTGSAAPLPPTPVDAIINKANAENATLKVAPLVDDLPFLRRVTIDLLGRIPTDPEIQRYLSWPAEKRRELVINELMKDSRFPDRWLVFFADLFRLRAGATGGSYLTAYVHKALIEGMPYDTLVKQLISASGRPDVTAEAGFVLSEDADPMAMAATTAQVFLGVRIHCAQCHNHPFDKWTREEFYDLAAFFGKTRKQESRIKMRLIATFTTEVNENSIKWPPEDKAQGKPRVEVKPRFPFELEPADQKLAHVDRFMKLRAAQEAERVAKNQPKPKGIDDLLDDAANKAAKQTSGNQPAPGADVTEEARRAGRELNVKGDLYKMSKARQELAELIANPRNRYFSRNLVNRLWGELVGKGFCNPLDDFRDDNEIQHPAALDYLADEFVASGYDFRALVRMIVTTQAYSRASLPADTKPTERIEAELAFASAPARRMLSEVLYDSLIQAGHLFDVKHAPGDNKKVVSQIVRERVSLEDLADAEKGKPKRTPKPRTGATMMAAGMTAPMISGGYDLEGGLEMALDPASIGKKKPSELDLEKLQQKSNEEIEAEEMMAAKGGKGMKLVERVVQVEIDENPRFTTSLRMATPAPPTHFLRVFGQPGRDALDDHRDHSPSMRQALLLLNGKLTHEAARVGKLEPIYPLLTGPKANLSEAIKLAYREILTREPTKNELAEAVMILKEAATPLDGMADLRWVLLNCHEFRFIP